MSDIESGLENFRIDDDPPVPVREGLPPRYRMRADAHYVEQLDSSLFSSPIRFLETGALEAPRQDHDVAPSPAFIESVKRHGVLQPLLVRTRGGRHQVIAGRKRLAAAIAAGLREVPCMVERVDDDQAPILAAATNVPATELTPHAHGSLRAPQVDPALGALTESLTAVVSSVNLLSTRSSLTQVVAADLVRAETSRALHLLLAVRVLGNGVAAARRSSSARAILERAAEQTAAERRLRGVELDLLQDHLDARFRGDEDLLAGAVGGLLLAAVAVIDPSREKTLTLRATTHPDERVALTVMHGSAQLAESCRSRLLDGNRAESSPSVGGVMNAFFALLDGVRRVAELHDGYVTADCAGGTSSVSIVVPA